jgi:hypothetical protein
MAPFPQLSDADIDNIVAYTSEPKAEPAKPTAGIPGTEAAAEGGVSNNVVLGALSVVMLILVVMLFMVNNVLTRVAKSNGIEMSPKEPTIPIWQAFARNQFFGFGYFDLFCCWLVGILYTVTSCKSGWIKTMSQSSQSIILTESTPEATVSIVNIATQQRA